MRVVITDNTGVPYVGVRAIAAEIRCSTATARRMCAAGDIEGIQRLGPEYQPPYGQWVAPVPVRLLTRTKQARGGPIIHDGDTDSPSGCELSVDELAERLGITAVRARALCESGRVWGASQRSGLPWSIPAPPVIDRYWIVARPQSGEIGEVANERLRRRLLESTVATSEHASPKMRTRPKKDTTPSSYASVPSRSASVPLSNSTPAHFGTDETLVAQAFARMPYASEPDIAAILRMDNTRARKALRALSALDYIEELQCGRTWRYALTDSGIRRMAQLSDASGTNTSLSEDIEQFPASQLAAASEAVNDILTRYPVSLQWRRSILKRMAALPTFYRLTALAAQAAPAEAAEGKVWFSWRRTDWLDGTIMLGEGRSIRVRRIGPTLHRRSLLYRLGSMAKSATAGGVDAVIMIVPGPAERRTVERWIVEHEWLVTLYIALEDDILGTTPTAINVAGADVAEDAEQSLSLLHPIRGSADAFDIETRTLRRQRAVWPLDKIIPTLSVRHNQESLDLDKVETDRSPSLPGNGAHGRRNAELLSWAQLDARAMSALRLVSDWPLGLHPQLVELGAYSRSLTLLHKLGLVYYAREGRKTRCVLSDAGSRHLTATDRTDLGKWRARWRVSVAEGGNGLKVSGPGLEAGATLSVDGGSIGTVETQIRHQDHLLEICATLGQGWGGAEVIETLPTHRSERWAKFDHHMRAIKPDAIVTVRGPDGHETSLGIEYEQRSSGQVMMAEKISPYQTYYRNPHRFEKSNEETLKTLFVFPNEAHASRFAAHCLSSREPWAELLQLYVSSMPELRAGFRGAIWLAGGGPHMGERVSLKQITAP